MAWLREQTGADSAVYEQVARLLQASSASGELLVQPACKRAMPPMSEGMTIGSYRVLRELGSGGMGIVYLTVRSDQVYHRLAALKVIRPELRSDPLVERFLAEREILARLDHPNIARIIDGGQTAEGLPYFVMDYVDGLPINIFCFQRSATLTQRLNLFRQICDAVQYLHDNHIVHRDLKPDNSWSPKTVSSSCSTLASPGQATAQLQPPPACPCSAPATPARNRSSLAPHRRPPTSILSARSSMSCSPVCARSTLMA
jgi:hypothetical protein